MAESQFYAILTDQGAALEATALATGIPVTLDKFVIGDGGGNAVTPDPTRTTLVNEVYRGTIKKAESQDNQVTFTLYVPPEAGGYTIREAGILTADGTLYSLSNSPDILKPTESNGAVISITFRYTLAVSSTSTVNVIVYEDYLTPEAADSKYLQIKNNLSEIKENGANAQKAARQNINAVASVNGAQPDANGNVTISTGSTVDLSNYYTKSEVDAMISSGDYASATPGAVKSYGLFTTYLDVTEGDTATGASIYYTGISGGDGGIDIARGSQPAGIWKILGKTNYVNGAFLAVRIS
ncbi:TPA: phage tail protein [Salmonella enterica]|nr:phage tail protein [Salmonella enterica]